VDILIKHPGTLDITPEMLRDLHCKMAEQKSVQR